MRRIGRQIRSARRRVYSRRVRAICLARFHRKNWPARHASPGKRSVEVVPCSVGALSAVTSNHDISLPCGRRLTSQRMSRSEQLSASGDWEAMAGNAISGEGIGCQHPPERRLRFPQPIRKLCRPFLHTGIRGAMTDPIRARINGAGCAAFGPPVLPRVPGTEAVPR